MKFWSNLLLRPISSNLAAGPCAENSYFKIHEMIAPRRAVHPCSTGATPLLRDAVRQNIVAFDGDFDDDFVVVNGEARLQRDPRASLRRVGMAAFGDSHAVEDDENIFAIAFTLRSVFASSLLHTKSEIEFRGEPKKELRTAFLNERRCAPCRLELLLLASRSPRGWCFSICVRSSHNYRSDQGRCQHRPRSPPVPLWRFTPSGPVRNQFVMLTSARRSFNIRSRDDCPRAIKPEFSI
jgi:hypothetical protein